ncbi:MAG TPA: hypothetical protein VLR54_05180 [Methanobacteriaceae archaeon]|nr:hypothetical protein [Methanobacteriaceae archaeon]
MKKINYLNSKPFKLQDDIIKSVSAYLEREGYRVTANHINHPNGRPKNLNGFIPDIRAIKNREEIIVEVQTSNKTLFQNKLKLKRFSYSGKRFWMVVPPECYEIAEIRKKVFNIPVELYCNDLNQEFKLESAWLNSK